MNSVLKEKNDNLNYNILYNKIVNIQSLILSMVLSAGVNRNKNIKRKIGYMLSKIYRISKTYFYKLLRAQATPHKVGLSIAIGFFVACFIPVGLHTVIVILLAFLLRVDRVIAFLATWISNPYTIPFMYPAFCFIGSKIVGANLTFTNIEMEIKAIIHDFQWHAIMELGKELLISMLVGGLICGLVVSAIGYYAGYVLFKKFQERKKAKKYLSKTN